MTNDLNALTFDVGEMFIGDIYPRDEVEFFVNAKAAYEANRLKQEIFRQELLKDVDAVKALEEEQEALYKKVNQSRYIFSVRGVSRDARRIVKNKVDEEFPPTRDFLGRVEPHPEADEVYANRMWSLHVESVTRPDGAVIVAPTEQQVAVIRGNAPDSEVAKVEAAIKLLSDGASSGFESASQEIDFLSSASPEA